MLRDERVDAMRARLSALHPGEHERIARRELPVCEWLLARHTSRDARTIAVNAPQGAGKSALCASAVEALDAIGVRAVTVSIDDFYLPHDAQRALALAHPDDPYLAHRGYPGTHDIPLGCKAIDALVGDRGEGSVVPVYDKSAHEGRGDRAPSARWRRVRGPFDLILVEGWMLGFARVGDVALPDPRMARVNALLDAYTAWTDRCDALVHLEMADRASVLRWRVEAERARRAAGEAALSDDDAMDYVRRFVPAYEAWRPRVRGPTLHLVLGEDRLPVATSSTKKLFKA